MLFSVEVDAPDLESLERRVRAAEDAGYAFVTFPDDPLRGGVEAGVRAAFLARRTTRIGLAPTLHTSTTEPFHLATQLASLDHASLGRAGWVVGATAEPAALATVGRTGVDPAEVADVVKVARGLWDSWEDDAVIKDVATGRFLDPRRVHHVHFESERFSVAGPLITPRPPQGQVVVIGWDSLGVTDRLDIALVGPSAWEQRAERARAAGAPLVFASVPWSFDIDRLRGFVDGVHFWHEDVPLPPAPDRPAAGRTLREALGLPRPENRYALARRTA
ncbi:LLM class flavin-dependent oxidoreductase [Dactylosporangium sp. NPDC049140]|uniref:LLM class flavin-dependent oxidoreductase n=1 Tax=Dactylosporangium sp. NPDC049140 TaxID=3155647 RepID=UPI0033CF63E3